MKGNTRGSFGKRIIVVAFASLIATMLPFVVGIPNAAAADVVLPPILLAGNDAEDDGNGNGNPASRVDTWSYQIKNPNPFDLTATIEANTGQFNAGDVGPPSGSWVQTQVVSVVVPANSQTQIVRRLARPPALGTTMDSSSYGFRAVWDDYPTVDSNYVGLRWPALLRIPASLGDPFTDPGSPFVGTGGVIHGFIDNRGPDFVGAFSCDFDASGNPTGDYTYHWWVNNSAYTGNAELMNVELSKSNGGMFNGVGFPRQSISWNDTRAGEDAINAGGVQVGGWQEARGWFRPKINNPNPGGTAGDNTWPWDGSTPPGSVWSLNSSPYDKHSRSLVQADDCATKYADLPVYAASGPTVTIAAPSAGSTVSGSVTIQIDATDNDPAGTLNVEISTDGGGAWSPASWNGAAGLYEAVWDTTAQPDGGTTVDARATDSDTNTTNASQVNVTVQNAPIPPTVGITAPTAGATISGNVTVAVDANDDDPLGTLNVEVSTDGGATWLSAPWNGANSRYEYGWDTTSEPEGAATVDARATDSDTNTTNATPVNVSIDNVPDAALVVGAADIGRCDRTSDDDTGLLLDTIFAGASGSIAIAGDVAYPNGSAADFVCFDEAWGQHKPLMRPVPGNHDYFTAGAADYFTYFGAQAGDPAEGYYSWTIDDHWIGVGLNSNCAQITGGCAAGGAQEQWLRGVLAANTDKNVLAYWHHPRWSNNAYNDNPIVQPLWQALYDYGAELLLVGHEHHYERYQPLDANGNPDASFGIREFIVGAGGTILRPQQRPPSPLSEEQQYDHHGVLKLLLYPDSYSWEFVSVGGAYTDSGTEQVHGAPGVSPTASITAPAAGSLLTGVATVQVDATDDDTAGSLDVDVSTDGGASWSPATWNGASSRYEFDWDTTGVANGPATIDARATDSDTNTTNATQVNVTIDNPPLPALVVAAGDISLCGADAATETGFLLDAIFAAESGSIAIPGDIAQGDGSPDEYDCFDQDWGQHKPLINPVPGNHDYLTAGAVNYYAYFGAQAGDPAEGYYSWTIDDNWIGIALNSNCAQITGGCAAGGAQEQWLRGMLTANADKNVLAYWHHPRWSKNTYNNNTNVAPLWDALYEHGAELVLNGHEHHYERYQPLDATGNPDAAFGIREFIVGTGGVALRPEVQSPSPYSEERQFDHHGVLKLYLHPDSFDWEFVSVGGAYTDSGSQPVHSAPNIAPTVSIAAPGQSAIVSGTTVVEVDATDNDPAGSLGVEVSTNGGTTWNPATWNGAISRYEYAWDTMAVPDGPATIDARATDSDTNTTIATPISVTVGNSPPTDYRSAVITDGADVYWRLADPSGTVAADEIGANDAAYLGSPTLGAPGLVGDGNNAVIFDGVNDTVHLTNSFQINQGGPYFTKSIEMWFNLDSTTTRQTLYEQGSISRGLSLYVVNGLLYAGIYNTSSNGGDTPWGPVFLSTPVTAGANHHAVMVFDQPADTFSLYLDGALVASDTGVGELHNHGRSAIGSQWDWARYHDGAQSGNRNFVAGTIDEVALYPIALDAATIANHYSIGSSSGPTPPSVAILAPSQGALLSGTVTVALAAGDDDPVGSLDVEVSVDGGATWATASWNAGAGRYEYGWDTTLLPDGPATVSARATDSDLNTTNATPVGVTITNGAALPYADEVLGDGAVIYWRLGEAGGTTVVDELGGNDQTYSGSPSLGSPALITDSDTAVDFDGINDTIQLVNSTQINQSNPFLTKTVELWFEADNVADRQVLLEQGSISRGLNIYLLNGRLYAGIYNTSTSGGDTPWGPVFLSTPVNTNTTYHVVMVFDQPTNTFSLYVNGTLADSSGGIGELYAHGRSAIGSQWDWARYHDGARIGNQYYFDGTLDEIAIYPTALDAAAVADHYVAGTT